MRYRRALLLLELGSPVRPALSALRRIAPGLEKLEVVAWMASAGFSWPRVEVAPGEIAPANAGRLAALRSEVADHGFDVSVRLVPELGADALAAICDAEAIDLLVLGSPAPASADVLYQVRRLRRLPILVAEREVEAGPVREIVCFGIGRLARASIGRFLRDHADPSMHVTLVGPRLPTKELDQIAQVAGVAARVEMGRSWRWNDEGARSLPADLFVLAQAPALLLTRARFPAPVLLLEPLPSPWRFEGRPVDAADVAAIGGTLRTRIEYAVAVGDHPPIPDQHLAFVTGGRVVAEVASSGGAVELPGHLAAAPRLGFYRVDGRPTPDPLAAIEQTIAVIRPGRRPLVLFDAEIGDETLRAVASLAGPPPPELLAVRMRPTRSFRSIRERLAEAGIAPRVLDARAVLDEGEGLDLSEPLDAVRLARVAERLRAAGHPVAALIHRSPLPPTTRGLRALGEPDLVGMEPAQPAPPPFDEGPYFGNEVEVELENGLARRWLLEAIAGAERTVHFQVYMAQGDDVGVQVEAALVAAAARGVRVRLLVDSLHGLHGSFGTENPLLARLAATPGVELRLGRPITELPSLVDLKQRDHRKIVVVDGRLALVGGRNLSHEYYTAFDEVAITPRSPWRMVPWLDAGSRLRGPAVAAVERAFREAWVEAGGDRFPIETPAPAGSTPVRVVVHRGLRDARTLETQLELIDGARSHVYVANGFPLLLELQHALVRAVRRGVRVRLLSGHVTPTHAGGPFPGPWSAARAAATELVHSRLDPIVEAGGEAFLLALHDIPGWAEELGVVHPHVHAKVMSVDGRICAVGSANTDITSAYWESELLLVVEDGAVSRGLEARLDQLMAGSTPLRRDDPAWRESARRRAWMRHWPGVLSI